MSSNVSATATANQFTIDDYCSTSNEFYKTFIPKIMDKEYIKGYDNHTKIRNFLKKVITEKNFTIQDEDITVIQDSSTGRILASPTDQDVALHYLVFNVLPNLETDTFVSLLTTLDTTGSFHFYGNVGIEWINTFSLVLNSKYEPDNLVKVLAQRCDSYKEEILKVNMTKEELIKAINSNNSDLKKNYQYMNRMLTQNKQGKLKDIYFKRLNEKVVKYFVMKEVEEIVRDFIDKDTKNTMTLWVQYLLWEG